MIDDPPPRNGASPGERRRFALVLTLAYLTVLAALMLGHDPWRDELRAWVIARDSASPVELVAHVRYEGYPLLWYLLLFVLTRLTPDPAAMQVLHLLIAAATAYVIARWSPFRRWTVCALVFGYFFLFEYALLSRPYALGALLLFTTCALLPRRRESYLWLAIPLVLLANTSAHGVMAAFAFTVALLVEAAMSGELRARALARRGRTMIAVALVAAGGVIGALQVRPPADASFRGQPVERESVMSPHAIAATGALIWASYAPVAQGGLAPVWGANALLTGERVPLALALLLSVVLAAAFGLLTMHAPLALTFYVLSHATVLVTAYTLFVGYTRHYGHLWLFAIAALWMAWGGGVKWRLPPRLEHLAARAQQRCAWLLAPLLAAQLVAGVQHLQRAARVPFSAVARAAHAAEQTAREGEPIVVVPDYLAPVASSALRAPVVLAELGQVRSFTPGRDAGQRLPAPRGRELEPVLPLLRERPSVIVIANRSLPERWEALRTQELAAFPVAFEPYERAWVYRVSIDAR